MLITPPYHSGVVEAAGRWLNLGLLYLAGTLKEGGYEVVYYDAMSFFNNYEEIRWRLSLEKPDFLAVSAITASYPDACKVTRVAKEVNPRCITVMGNVHPTLMWPRVLKENRGCLDFIIRGEGEITIRELFDCINAGDDPAKVPGLAFLRKGKPFATMGRPFITDLDKYKPAWELVSWRDYFYRPKENSTLAVVSSSRGCNQRCSFCSQQLFWERSWRARSPEDFVSELKMLRERYSVDVVMLADETPTLSRERWIKILKLLKELKLGIDLLMEARAADIIRDHDLLELYREAGIVHIYLGVEAVDQQSLDIFCKNQKVEEAKKALSLLNAHDIITETSFVLGLPQETKEHIEKTLELAKYYNPDMAFFLAIAPWPYGDLYGYLCDYIEEEDYRNYNLVEPVVRPLAMSRTELKGELIEATKRFYLHKFQNLASLSSYKQEFLKAVMKLLMEHSYLASYLKSAKQNLPEEVKDLLPISPIP